MMKTIYTLALLLIFTILSAQTVKDSTIQHQFELTGGYTADIDHLIPVEGDH